MAHQIIRLPEVIKRTGRSRSSIYLGIKDGTFPRPIKLGARSIGWTSTAIDDWIEERIQKSEIRNQKSEIRNQKSE